MRPPLAVTTSARTTTSLDAGGGPGGQRLAAKDPTLWGPDAESEASIRLGWVDLPADVAPTAGRDRRAARRAVVRGHRPGRALRHGRLVPRAGGDLADVRGAAGRSSTRPTRTSSVARSAGTCRRPSSSCPASPAAPSRPTASAAHSRQAFEDAGHRRRRRDRRRHRPRLRPREAGPRAGYRRVSSPTRRRRSLQRPHRVRAGPDRAGRRRHRRAARRGRGGHRAARRGLARQPGPRARRRDRRQCRPRQDRHRRRTAPASSVSPTGPSS